MEQGFLMDSNVIIDYLGNKLPPGASSFIDKLPCIISVITRIEILGWHNASAALLSKLELFLENAFAYMLTEPIIQETIRLRQKFKIKLPDAIVAATALMGKHTLITHNTDDFKNIQELDLLDPWNL